MVRKLTLTVLGSLSLSGLLTGCQSTVGGQTLPSAYYLRDDVQYFPTGPEFKLTNTVQAMEKYKLDQQSFTDQGAGGSRGGSGYDQ